MTSLGQDRQRSAIQLADRIRRLGLAAPVSILLEAGRPLAFVAAQLLWLSQPLLSFMLPRQEVAGAAELLEDPESVGVLIQMLGREPGHDQGGG